jgi:PadR family transcriptional regulator, regulatory protein AphA
MTPYRVRTVGNTIIVESLPGGFRLRLEQDALDLIAACGANGTNLLLLHDQNIPDDFFDLSTGLAGQLLLKFGIYAIRVAAVVSPQRSRYGKFPEMMVEQNRGNEFRFFFDQNDAEEWLLKSPG